MKKFLQTVYISWLGVTLLVIASLVAIYLRNGMTGLNLFIQDWALSDLAVTLAATTMTWLLLGALLHLLVKEKINSANLLMVAGFILVMLVYLNILRERFRYGDYHYYFEAAAALANNLPLPDTYLYLPLWASLLQFLVPLGEGGVFLILWLVNIFALGAFYLLLNRILERYGFSNQLAALVVVVFMLVNTPLLRTLGYVQVNILVMDLIFLSMLTYPKKELLSALTLALAIHLKTSPAVIVLAFLLERNWRWLAWFVFSFLLIGAIPLAFDGLSPYIEYLQNIVALTQLPNTNFHNTSFDSFLRFLNPFFGINNFWTGVTIYGAKAALILAGIFVMSKNVRSTAYCETKGPGAAMLNALPSLFVIMTLASPIVWDHHGLFVTLSFLVLFKRVDSPTLWMWFSLAYFLEFMIPSFDFFPWSYGRLFAPIIALGLMWRIPLNNVPSRFFNAANRWRASLAS